MCNTWVNPCVKVTKKFSGWKQAHVGMEPSKTGQTRWERHCNTFTPSLHLVPLFVNCVHRRVVEGSWEGIVGCVVHACWCAWRVCYVVGGCNVVATEHGRYSLSCMQKLWAVLGLHGMLGVLSYVVKFYCCWMWQNLVWIVFYVEGCGVSSAEYRVHLV